MATNPLFRCSRWTKLVLCALPILLLALSGRAEEPADRRIRDAIEATSLEPEHRAAVGDFVVNVWASVADLPAASPEAFEWYLDSLAAYVVVLQALGISETQLAESTQATVEAVFQALGAELTRDTVAQKAEELEGFIEAAKERVEQHYEGRRVALYKQTQDPCLLGLVESLRSLGDGEEHQIAVDMLLSPILCASIRSYGKRYIQVFAEDPTNIFGAGYLYSQLAPDEVAMEALESTLETDVPASIFPRLAHSMAAMHYGPAESAKTGLWPLGSSS